MMTLISPGDCSGIMTVSSPSGSTLQCDTWLWDDMPLNSPVTAPCNVASGSGMTCHEIRPNVRHIGIPDMVSSLTISPKSTCHSAPVCEILSITDHPKQKNYVMSIFKMADLSHLGFYGSNNGFFEKPMYDFLYRVSTGLTEQISRRIPGYSRRDFKKNPGHVCIVSARYVMYRMNYI